MERTELREVVAVAGGDGGGVDGDGVMVAEVARWLTGLMAGPEQNITACVRNALNKTSNVSYRLSPTISVKLVFHPSQTCINQNLGHVIFFNHLLKE